MIKLIPINDKTQIVENWHFFAPGFRKVIEHTDGSSSEVAIFNGIYAGNLFMQVIFSDDKYAGFITGYLDVVPDAKKFLVVNHLYILPQQPKEIFWKVIDEMEKFGKQYQCEAIKFYTTRDNAFERKLSDSGWKRGYTQFVKTIGGDNGR